MRNVEPDKKARRKWGDAATKGSPLMDKKKKFAGNSQRGGDREMFNVYLESREFNRTVLRRFERE